MPAARVLIKIHAHRNLAFDLKAGDVGGEQIAAAGADFIGQCKQCRQDRRRRVSAQRVVAVVEVERMRRGAVDQRGVEHADFFVGAEHIRRPCCRTQRTRADARRRIGGAGDGHADRIEDADLRPVFGIGRQVVVVRSVDEFGEFEGEGHGVIRCNWTAVIIRRVCWLRARPWPTSQLRI